MMSMSRYRHPVKGKILKKVSRELGKVIDRKLFYKMNFVNIVKLPKLLKNFQSS
jgi:hypothetical protein